MALKFLFSTFLIAVLAAGCSRSAAPEAAPEEPEVLSVTRWTEKTELFAEYPPLAAGSTSRFAIHLTRLDGFKALTEGNVEVRLEGGSGQSEVFRVDAPSRPGIFGVDVKPTHAGKRQLVIVLRATGLNDELRVGDVDVHPNAEAARAAAPAGGEDAPVISFLKEQQWSLDFGTALVKEQAVRESIRVPARLEARPGGAADVVAPMNAHPSSSRFAARSFARPKRWPCGRQLSRRTRRRLVTNSRALLKWHTAKARLASLNCSTPFAPHHERELAVSTCGLRRAWHRSPWSAQWEMSCGLETAVLRSRGDVARLRVQPFDATHRRSR